MSERDETLSYDTRYAIAHLIGVVLGVAEGLRNELPNASKSLQDAAEPVARLIGVEP